MAPSPGEITRMIPTACNCRMVPAWLAAGVGSVAAQAHSRSSGSVFASMTVIRPWTSLKVLCTRSLAGRAARGADCAIIHCDQYRAEGRDPSSRNASSRSTRSLPPICLRINVPASRMQVCSVPSQWHPLWRPPCEVACAMGRCRGRLTGFFRRPACRPGVSRDSASRYRPKRARPPHHFLRGKWCSGIVPVAPGAEYLRPKRC